VFLTLSLLLLPGIASAQAPASPGAKKGFVETRTESGTNVTFDDDKALGAELDPFMDIVKAPPRAARWNLLRPRNNFISEMLKSVENM
jgi:hypothetical protein